MDKETKQYRMINLIMENTTYGKFGDTFISKAIANSTPPIMENKPIFEEDYYEDQCWKRDRKDD